MIQKLLTQHFNSMNMKIVNETRATHEFHETCHSVTFYFMKKKKNSDINRKCLLQI